MCEDRAEWLMEQITIQSLKSEVSTAEPPRLRGRDTDWDKYESEQAVRNLRSFHALKAQGRDALATAAEECAHWNRMYREATWETAREAATTPFLSEAEAGLKRALEIASTKTSEYAQAADREIAAGNTHMAHAWELWLKGAFGVRN